VEAFYPHYHRFGALGLHYLGLSLFLEEILEILYRFFISEQSPVINRIGDGLRFYLLVMP
jgi:hypothetical protein